ncbi:MAG: hypothetical protein A4E65_02957 [Syntrophorhabdus sp. PtaU1.Bin153]|nr:MAG: hypothetical protein A4E65_02957 [Syntrophorhabdus sp. PtaU1.Bin153]
MAEEHRIGRKHGVRMLSRVASGTRSICAGRGSLRNGVAIRNRLLMSNGGCYEQCRIGNRQ